jgi:RNA recognition motif-containing protein
MEERDLRQFLTQFGNVINCRVARKISTGQPKGYAFVRFDDLEVAKIAQDTLHGYFLGVGHTQRLVCQLRPAHRGMFYSTDSAIRKRKDKIRTELVQRETKLADPAKLKEMTTVLIKHDAKKRAKLAALGIEYDFPGYGSSSGAGSSSKKDEKASDDKSQTLSSPSTSESKTDVDAKTSSASKVERKRKNSVGSQDSAQSKSRKNKKGKGRKSAP